jgi:hypothetical protein
MRSLQSLNRLTMNSTSFPTWSQVSPKDAAEAAFYYQTSEKYNELVEAYDDKTVSLLAVIVDELLEAQQRGL